MAKRFLGNANGAAVFTMPASGNPDAPFNSPVANLDKVIFHTALDYMEVAGEATKSISFPKANFSSGQSISDVADSVEYDARNTTWLLFNHNLGYVPHCIVVADGDVLPPGAPMQWSLSNGSVRIVTPYVTTTQVRLKEVANLAGANLSSKSVNFKVLVFNVPTQRSDFFMQPGRFRAGTFDSKKRYIRVATAGEATKYRIQTGPNADVNNGTLRIWTANGSKIEDRAPGTYKGNFPKPGTINLSVASDNEGAGKTETEIRRGQGLKVWDEGNLVWSTERKMVSIFQTLNINNENFVFPNHDKDYWYNQSIVTNTQGTPDPADDRYRVDCTSWCTLKKENWTNTRTLATLNSNQGDFLMVLARAKRTKNPAKMGGGTLYNVPKMVPENEWIPCNAGTIILESFVPFRRILSVFLDGNKLKVRWESSVIGISMPKRVSRVSLGGQISTVKDNSDTQSECPVRHLQSKSSPINLTASGTYSYDETSGNGCKKTTTLKFGSTWQLDFKVAVGRYN